MVETSIFEVLTDSKMSILTSVYSSLGLDYDVKCQNNALDTSTFT